MFNFKVGKHFEIVLEFAPRTGIIAEVVEIFENGVKLKDLNEEFSVRFTDIRSVEQL